MMMMVAVVMMMITVADPKRGNTGHAHLLIQFGYRLWPPPMKK